MVYACSVERILLKGTRKCHVYIKQRGLNGVIMLWHVMRFWESEIKEIFKSVYKRDSIKRIQQKRPYAADGIVESSW
jgi:hypothetical protein